MMFELERIDHVALAVRDVEISAGWYCETLGFKRLHEGLWNGVPVFVGRGEMAIALFPANERKPEAARARGILHFAFGSDRKNFLAAQRGLAARGIAFEFQDHEISHSIYLHDPDGHQVEITTYEVG